MQNKPGNPAQRASAPRQVKRLVLLGALFIAFGTGVWWPAHQQRNELRDEIGALRAELERDLADARHLPVLHQRVGMLHEALSGARRYVPREDEQDQLLRDLTEAMQAHAVADPELTTHETRRFADYSMVPMTLEFHGPFPEAFGVLERIETLSRLVRVDRLEIEPRDRSSLSPVRVTLSLSTFFAHGEGLSPRSTAGGGP